MPDANPSSGHPKVAAIACGGTGGHLFPGLAVGEELLGRGCQVILLISPKDIDQQAVRGVTGMEVVTLPAVGLTRWSAAGFMLGAWKSYHAAKKLFAKRRPCVTLAMGGFTSAPAVLAGKHCGAKTFLHESNTVPGRANRWLASSVDGAFVYFPEAASRLKAARVEVAGMPVRPQFLQPLSPGAARLALGLLPDAPVLLVMGGSQGAGKINEWVMGLLPQLRAAAPELQFIHLTGAKDVDKVRAAYVAQKARAVVRGFMGEMEVALAAADVAVSRAGASSLAEFAARRLPAVLIPYPTAADNHQYYNARAFAQSGAARMLQQESAAPEKLAGEILNLIRDTDKQSAMRRALEQWRQPNAAGDIAEMILNWPAQSRSSPQPGAPRLNAAKLGALNV